MRFQAVAFDMDGVLLDTEKVYRKCWLANGRSIGIPEDEMTVICEKMAGGTKAHNGRVMKERMGEDFDYLSFRKRTVDMVDEYIRLNGVEIKNGVVETLNTLKNLGIRMAVATSTDRNKAVERLTRAGIIKYFDAFVFGDEIENGKPNPDIYLKACEKLGAAPEDTVGVEDSINGVTASSAAGLYTVMVIDLISPNDYLKRTADKIYDIMPEMVELFY